jgi:two-component system, OmpR family, sensor histidine kinase KdpD
MTRDRPDPDEPLERAQAEARKEKRGRLTIFFGAAPGVGKTFAMLLEAGYQRDVEGRDIVVGVIETHGRFETTTLLAGFERLPKKQISYRGSVLEEFDLDAALARRPSLLLLDELAHTNAAGSRHAKRSQDVEELLEAGIEVYTTLNVQHIESLNDVVAQITGIVVRETVPDSVVEAADDVKLVDLTPDELLERLREGKVYLPAQAQRAMENFFRKGNLIALRELALRKTAERVDADMQAWRRAQGIEKTWAASDRVLVCISPSPYSANLLRVGRRMAAGLHAPWYAVNVETPATLRLPATDRAQIAQNLRLAEQLGAETVTLSGERSAEEILVFARERNITKIVVGKPRGRSIKEWFRRSFVDELILGSGEIDVYVTTGEPETVEPAPAAKPRPAPEPQTASYIAACSVALLATAFAYLVFGRHHLSDVAMTYVVGTVLVATRFGFRPSIVGALLSVLCFNYFFIPPYFTFLVTDTRHLTTFLVMLLVAGVISGLTERVRGQVEVARRGERKSAALYALSKDLFGAQDPDALLKAAGRRVAEIFESEVAVFVPDEAGGVRASYAAPGLGPLDGEQGVVRWVFAHRREAGVGTPTLTGSRGFYVPLVAPGKDPEVFGVLGIYTRDQRRFEDPEQQRLAHALATQIAMALERGRLAEETERARIRIEAEQFRNTLLSSVSHDLRTPLAVMRGAATTLMDDDAALSESVRRDLTQALVEETERLDRLVRDLLDMTRLESGAVRVNKEWHSVEEMVGSALNRTESRLVGRKVSTSVPPTLLVPCDSVLIQQVLVNLLENAAKYTPERAPIEVAASAIDGSVMIEVADRGPGVPAAEQAHIFEKFQRGSSDRTKGGVGLGLTICRAIVVAHGGRIWVESREGGGASFRFTLPARGRPSAEPLPEIPETPEQARLVG